MPYRAPTPEGLKPKELVGVPWRVAMALQTDGWYLRSDIIWYKPNALPESVKDRPTRAHEYVFLLSKSEKYYYNFEAIQETGMNQEPRNKRTVWSINTEAFNGAHFATFPPSLVKPCILAGSHPGDVVIDPFFGSGTTGLVAAAYNRRFVGIEIKAEYVELAQRRLGEKGIQFDVINT
jgi:DNA modification methylase